MAALLVPACFSVSELLCHALRSGGAPLHGYLGRGMAGGSQKEFELHETPSLHPRHYHKDVGRPPGPRDPGPDHAVQGPL